MDDDMINDDIVGFANISLEPIFMKGKTTEWYPILYKGNKAGEIYLNFEFYSD